MADRHKISDDTMDIGPILNEYRERQAASAGQQTPDSEERYVLRVKPAETVEEGDDFLIFDDEPPRGTSRAAEPEKSKKPLIITLAIVGVLLVSLVMFLVLKGSSGSSSDHPEGNVAKNVTVSGINVGGMSYDAALNVLGSVERRLADTIRIEVDCGENKKVVLNKDNLTFGFNTEEILRQALQASESGTKKYDIRVQLDDSSLAAAAERIAAESDRKAQDAKITAFNADKKDMFTYQDEVVGLVLDKADLTAQLREMVGKGIVTGSVTAKFTEDKPKYTTEFLKKNIKKLSSFTTESTNTANGMSNQALSLSACNGSIIEPGATWSFNKCTGDTNLESRGYLPAGVIVQGRHEIGIGGGICQSSTTIYNAGLLCGMTVVERYEHYYPSSYVDYGRDATIDYGNLDLKLKNPFEYQLFLKCWMDDYTLHAEIYGLPAKDFDEIRISTTEPKYTKTSFSVKASRTYYLNGNKVRTEELPSSTYYLSAPEDDTPKPTTAPTTPPTQPSTDAPTVPVTPTEGPGDDPTYGPATPDEA